MSELSNEEIATCAKINFMNFAKMNKHLEVEKHPMWIIAMEQLDEVIKRLEQD